MEVSTEGEGEEEENKLPLKRVELSLSKFNEVAIPHHLDLLRQHKANILKYSEKGEYGRAVREREASVRCEARLRALIGELDALRRAVRVSDRPAFDAVTARARADTRAALAVPAAPSPVPPPHPVTDEDEGELTGQLQLQLQVDETAASGEEALREWTALQEEVGAVHGTWRALHEAARVQREPLARTADAVEVAAEETAAARTHLAAGERLRVAGGAAMGAALGALAAGPVGLLVGLKAGAAAALAGSLLGYAAAAGRLRLLPSRARALTSPPPTDKPD